MLLIVHCLLLYFNKGLIVFVEIKIKYLMYLKQFVYIMDKSLKSVEMC
jgi:hypothetical protein